MDKNMIVPEEEEPPGTSFVFGQLPIKGNLVPLKHSVTQPSEKTKVIWIRKNKGISGLQHNPKVMEFRGRFFPDVVDTEWNDWHWQLRHRISHLVELERFVKLSNDELNALKLSSASPPFAITPYFASLLDENDPQQPLRRTVIPVTAEHLQSLGEAEDPLGEEDDSPVPGLVHRYPDRVLFLVTDFCSTYCRYCTRSRMVGHGNTHKFSRDRWEKAIAYIEATPTIRDVLLSGGDPLTLPDSKLEWILSRLRGISHVELVRIGTKAPVVLPQRITPPLTRMLRRYHPLFMSIHFTHPDELTPEVREACERLADAGIPLGSQTVLLSGVNDSLETMKRLLHALLQIRVRPYYLYQCDPISGSSHFRTPVHKGIEIIQGLRGHTSGYAVPTYVIDAPGGGGKIPLLPEYVVGRDGNCLLLKSYDGHIYRYPDQGGIVAPENSCKEYKMQ